jgi:hypothetical protein
MRSNALTHPARRSRSPRTALVFSTALLLTPAATLLSVGGPNAGTPPLQIVQLGSGVDERGSGFTLGSYRTRAWPSVGVSGCSRASRPPLHRRSDRRGGSRGRARAAGWFSRPR